MTVVGCEIALVLDIVLLNSLEQLLVEAGKDVMALLLLGFYAVAQFREVLSEVKVFDETVKK